MNKKLLSIISTAAAIVLALVMILLSEHNIKTARNNDELLDSGMDEIFALTDGMSESGNMPHTLEYLRQNRERAQKAINDIRSVCDYYEKVTVPNKLRNQLTKVRAGIPAMRRFLDSYEKFFNSTLESEFRENAIIAADLVDGMRESFYIAEKEFITQMNELRHRKQGLLWL